MMYEVYFYYGTRYGYDFESLSIQRVNNCRIPDNLRYVIVSNDVGDNVAVYGVSGYANLCQNDIVDNGYQMVILSGEDADGKGWTSCISHKDAEIFVCNLETIMGSLNFWNKYKRMKLWRIGKALRKYVTKRGGICYTGEFIS